jgi:hypothetical protein
MVSSPTESYRTDERAPRNVTDVSDGGSCRHSVVSEIHERQAALGHAQPDRSPTLRRVPVSRKRKKKPGKSGRPRQPNRVDQRGSAADLSEHDRRELAEAWQGLTAHREQVHAGRRTRAAAAATDLVTDLVTSWPPNPT